MNDERRMTILIISDDASDVEYLDYKYNAGNYEKAANKGLVYQGAIPRIRGGSYGDVDRLLKEVSSLNAVVMTVPDDDHEAKDAIALIQNSQFQNVPIIANKVPNNKMQEFIDAGATMVIPSWDPSDIGASMIRFGVLEALNQPELPFTEAASASLQAWTAELTKPPLLAKAVETKGLASSAAMASVYIRSSELHK